MTDRDDLRILLVEDSPDDALMLEMELKRGGFKPHCHRVETADEMYQALSEKDWDVIISDYSLPNFSGLEALRIYNESSEDIPFIIVSGTIGEEMAVDAMKAGANDYILKGTMARLAPAIKRELRDAEARAARRVAEEKLKQSKHLSIIGEFSSSLFHDLKNPLQVIMTSGEFLASDILKSNEREKYGDVISHQVKRIMSMTQDVLDFIRGEVKLNLSQVDVLGLANEIVGSNETEFSKAGVTLAVDFSGDDEFNPVVMADEQKIWRVLQNLVSNAKDAMSDGGNVTIMIEDCGEDVTIDVADTGSGIPESIRENLFQPFVTAGKEHGTGLGLAIVKSAIDAHGGTISFDVEEGIGTTFHILLPKNQNRIKEQDTKDANSVLSNTR